MKQVRWGIMGAAKIARTYLCPAIHLAAGGTFSALASHTPKRAAQIAQQYPGLKIHDSYDALLSDPGIDAIYVPLPNDMHVDMTKRCLAAGKHVLCEKPIAMAAPQIDELIMLRDKTGLVAAEAFMVLYHPQWARIRELIADGAIGTLCHVSGVFSYNNADEPDNIRNLPERGGGGLPDIGVYPTIVTRFVTGQEPSAVQARIDWENGVDVNAEVRARFDGFSLNFYCSMRMAARQELVFHGSKGWIRATTPFNVGSYGDAQLEIRTADGASRFERFGEVNQYTTMIEAFNRSVQTGAPFACPLEFSRANQVVIDMAKAADPPG